MGIISGQDAKLQIGLESSWGTAVVPTVAIDFTSESLKYIPNLISENALIGRKTVGRVDKTGEKVAGGFSMILKPDNVGMLLGAALGSEASAALAAAVAERVQITCPAESAGNLDGSYFLLS